MSTSSATFDTLTGRLCDFCRYELPLPWPDSYRKKQWHAGLSRWQKCAYSLWLGGSLLSVAHLFFVVQEEVVYASSIETILWTASYRDPHSHWVLNNFCLILAHFFVLCPMHGLWVQLPARVEVKKVKFVGLWNLVFSFYMFALVVVLRLTAFVFGVWLWCVVNIIFFAFFVSGIVDFGRVSSARNIS